MLELRLLNQFYAALDELGEGFALEHSVLEQGQVNELADKFGLAVGEGLLDERVVGVEHEVHHRRHFAVESHAWLQATHLLHAAHVFALGDDDWGCGFDKRLSFHHEFCLVEGWQGVLEGLGEGLLLIFWQFLLLGVFLDDEFVDDITIHTGEAGLLQLLLQQAEHGGVELTVHQEDIVALCLSGIDVGILVVLVLGVEVDKVAVLVGLVVLDEGLILFVGVVLAFGVLEEGKRLGFVVEGFVAEHSVVDEDFDVVPLLLKLLAVVLEDAGEAVAHFLGDVGGNLLHVLVALQVAARYVQRNVG